MRVKPLRNDLKRRVIELIKQRPNEVWYASKINRELLKLGGEHCVVTLNRAIHELVEDKALQFDTNGTDLKLVEQTEPVQVIETPIIEQKG